VPDVPEAEPEHLVPQSTESCPYCDLRSEPVGGWIYRDERWLVQHGPAGATIAGGLQIISVRHFIDFAEMNDLEASSLGPLIARLDTALRATTNPERVHLVSTRDRVGHFHAWLYPRPASHPLRGTAFLAAPQSSEVEDIKRVAEAVRQRLANLKDRAR
jgi:diadenosine tetraphosphate (Ap4A) HIT family hydrolase